MSRNGRYLRTHCSRYQELAEKSISSNCRFKVQPLQGRKFVVVGSAGAQLKTLLLGGVVQVAIMPRVYPSPAKKPPVTAREWFNSAYEVVTSANAGAMP